MTHKPEWWARFWNKVDVSADCWNWTAATDNKGYPRFSLGGKNRRAVRVIYELKYGQIPPGMEVCHSCDNPSCVNPDHLFVGTSGDNANDCARKGRALKVLTKEQVVEVMQAEGTQQSIADRFGISQSMVNHIKSGIRHKTVILEELF